MCIDAYIMLETFLQLKRCAIAPSTANVRELYPKIILHHFVSDRLTSAACKKDMRYVALSPHKDGV